MFDFKILTVQGLVSPVRQNISYIGSADAAQIQILTVQGLFSPVPSISYNGSADASRLQKIDGSGSR